MKAYWSLLKMRLIKGLQYRIAALAGVTTQFFWGFMYIMIFDAFYKSTSTSQPISFQQLIQVLWLQQGFLVFIILWYRDSELINLITSGNIAYELCRPLDLYRFWYVKLLAQRLSGAMLRCLPILAVAALLPAPYGFQPPGSLAALLLFIPTLLIGLLLVVSITMLIYISIFYTLNATGSMLLFAITGEFFCGLLIPIPLMPDWLRTIAYILPFRYTADLPFRIYAGNIDPKEALWSIGVQLLWLGFLIILGRLWMNRSLKRVVVQGG